VRVRVEAEIDFSDEGNEYLDEDLLDDLLVVKNNVASFVGGCVNKKNHYQKNNVLLVGPVNSGKSSVFNRLLGFERAIVSDVPGTTRDIVSSELFYESNSFSVFDSAGLRDTDDFVEGVGIKNTLKEIKSADLVVGVFEVYNKDMIGKFKNLSKGNKFICLQNKIDINSKEESFFDCCVSAKTGDGFEDLKQIIVNFFDSGMGVKQEKYKYLIRERHENIFNGVLLNLNSACEGLEQNNSLELVAEDLKNARSGFDELVGKKFSDSLLGDIFSSYCIGK
jgi:tRNA modification GTPase